jgi:hypothetical protein
MGEIEMVHGLDTLVALNEQNHNESLEDCDPLDGESFYGWLKRLTVVRQREFERLGPHDEDYDFTMGCSCTMDDALLFFQELHPELVK